MNTEIVTINNMPQKLVNKQLAKATDSIYKIAMGIKRNLYEIAYIISTVDESKCYEEDGFESVHQWTEKSFGFKKTMSYSLLKIGKEYTRTIKDAKTGRITGYTSNLLPLAFDKEDFTTTQVEAMLPLGYEKAKEEVDAQNITPDMSAKEIKKYIKSLKDADKEPEQDEGAFEDKEPTEADIDDMEKSANEKPEDKKLVFGQGGCLYSISRDVFADNAVIISPADIGKDEYRDIVINTITSMVMMSTSLPYEKMVDIRAYIGSYFQSLENAKTTDTTGAESVEG